MKYLIAVALLVFSGCGFAAGFDCNKTKTQIEKLICGDQELSELDSELNIAFSNFQSNISGVNEEIGKNTDWVKSEQKQWIVNVRNKCQNIQCLKDTYKTALLSCNIKSIAIFELNRNQFKCNSK